jgi:hypothetical protein
MTQHENSPEDAEQPSQARHHVRVPGFNSDTEVGLGDVIKRVTSFAGIKPCGPCQQRAVRFNQWLGFRGRQ